MKHRMLRYRGMLKRGRVFCMEEGGESLAQVSMPILPRRFTDASNHQHRGPIDSLLTIQQHYVA